MNGKWMLAAMAVAAAAMTVSAHLPSPYDARFAIDRERELKAKELRGAARDGFQSPATWSSTQKYSGDYTTFSGDTVIWKKDRNGRDLMWWAKFYAEGDEPGTVGEGGGTNPWVMINSLTPRQSSYNWQGWTGSAPNSPVIATWRNGAKGAYSFTHDDIGSMPFAKAIKPAYELGRESGFEQIKQAWGVYVGEMEEDEWEFALKMVADGHEMFNHSWDHTSAADQYQWFYPGTTIPDFDPSIPYEVRGLEVVGLWGNPNVVMSWDPYPTSLTLTNDMISVSTNDTSKMYWTQNNFKSGVTGLTVTLKGNTEKITVNGKDLYVKYTKKGNLAGLPADGSGEVTNEGFISAADPGWFDLDGLKKYGQNGWSEHTSQPNNNWWVNPADVPANCTKPDWTVGGTDPTGKCKGAELNVAPWCSATEPCKADKGAPGMLVKVFTVKAWSGNDFNKNMKQANDEINAQLYSKISSPGKHFAKGKSSEYFGYPFDAYSLATHDSLYKYGIYQARGGSKTPQVMKGDFFHPYAIDFDAFYIINTQWDATKGGTGWVYPDNPHVWLGLNEMVNEIIAKNGYMIREFHAVADIADGDWYKDASGASGKESNQWILNSPAAERGGWWGGITKNQLRAHYQHVASKINSNDLVVYTPSEAVKYRLTANACSNPSLQKNGNEYTLSVSTDANGVIEQQRDEISVIVKIDNTSELNVEYTNGSGNPRLAPKKLDGGTAWAVNFNPFVSSVRLIPGQSFPETPWVSDINPDEIDLPSGDGGGTTCNPFVNPDCATSISKTKDKATSFAFTGIRNGQINLRLNAGVYTAQLYNMQGRMVGSANINAIGGVTATGLRTDNLAKGLFILHVKDAKGAAVLQHKLMLK